MAIFLGVDTGGTYTDAVILDEVANVVLGKAKALTSRHDLAVGIGQAVDAAIAAAGVGAADVALVSLSTTLVLYHNGRVAANQLGAFNICLETPGVCRHATAPIE